MSEASRTADRSDFEKGPRDDGRSASSPAEPRDPDFQFERPDWVLFRSVSTLSQKAGVPASRLRRLVLRELVDNALDAGGQVTVGALDARGDRYFVQDDGPGLLGEPADIARLFSISRPLVSSKLWRLPSRGAMGNGLRVVAGAVAASNGRLEVWTHNRHLILTPQDDGSTALEAFAADFPTGTRVEVTFGEALPHDRRAMEWAEHALQMAAGGTGYDGKPSPWWYDADHFFELLQAAGPRPVRDLIASLDGCTGAKAGKIAAAFRATPCHGLSREQATELLQAARAEARPVRPERLGAVGPLDDLPPAYIRERGTVILGGRAPKAEVPFVVEVWAYADSPTSDGTSFRVHVNRTPATGEARAYKDKKRLTLWGCGLRHQVEVPKGSFDIVVNITTPYCPITTDGKEPDLSAFVEAIGEGISRATRRARRDLPKELATGATQKAIILAHLLDGVAKASGNGRYRYNQRQLFYVLRKFVIDQLGAEPTWGNFCGIITDYEDEHGDVPGMYRDPRGTLYHPHLHQDIALGTLAVESYRRPEWIFNKVLYLEKEGFFEILKADRWPERHDCALLTGKGFSTRAIRDLLDLLADSGEPVTVFCVHDADAYGTMIYQTLQEETKARPRRRIEIVNFGLEPWEAREMGLEAEKVPERDSRAAVADYVLARHDGEWWAEWLQRTRHELNAMTTPQFLAWLNAKMAEHGSGKVVPPAPVIAETLTRNIAKRLENILTERVLKEARIEEQVTEAMREVTVPDEEDLERQATEWLAYHPELHWGEYVDDLAGELAEEQVL